MSTRIPSHYPKITPSNISKTIRIHPKHPVQHLFGDALHRRRMYARRRGRASQRLVLKIISVLGQKRIQLSGLLRVKVQDVVSHGGKESFFFKFKIFVDCDPDKRAACANLLHRRKRNRADQLWRSVVCQDVEASEIHGGDEIRIDVFANNRKE